MNYFYIPIGLLSILCIWFILLIYTFSSHKPLKYQFQIGFNIILIEISEEHPFKINIMKIS